MTDTDVFMNQPAIRLVRIQGMDYRKQEEKQRWHE
jgi:hypothetical protein